MSLEERGRHNVTRIPLAPDYRRLNGATIYLKVINTSIPADGARTTHKSESGIRTTCGKTWHMYFATGPTLNWHPDYATKT